jgi:hypothetical protein
VALAVVIKQDLSAKLSDFFANDRFLLANSQKRGKCTFLPPLEWHMTFGDHLPSMAWLTISKNNSVPIQEASF